MSKIAVIGSRKFTDYEKLCEKLDGLMDPGGEVNLSGGAKGTDQLAQRYAQDRGHAFILFKPYHLIDPQVDYSPRYFFTRNKQIADNAEWVIAFWDGQSSGTRHMIEYCQRNRKRLEIVEI